MILICDYDGIMCFTFMIAYVVEMEVVLLYAARISKHRKIWREEYKRHHDTKKRWRLSYVSRGGHNSSSYSTIMRKFEKDWPLAMSLKCLRNRVARACRNNDERVTTYVLDIIKGLEENKVTHYRGFGARVVITVFEISQIF